MADTSLSPLARQDDLERMVTFVSKDSNVIGRHISTPSLEHLFPPHFATLVKQGLESSPSYIATATTTITTTISLSYRRVDGEFVLILVQNHFFVV